MIVSQFVLLAGLLLIILWAAERRGSAKAEQMDRLLEHLGHIDNQLHKLSELPTDIARAIHAEQKRREQDAVR